MEDLLIRPATGNPSPDDGFALSFSVDLDHNNKLLTSADIQSGPDAFMTDLGESSFDDSLQAVVTTQPNTVTADSRDSSSPGKTVSKVGTDATDTHLKAPALSQNATGHAEGSVAASRARRKAKKRSLVSEIQYVTCPICSLTLSTEDLTGHIETELRKLDKLPKPKKNYDHSSKKVPACTSQPTAEEAESEYMDSQTRYKSYLKIRTKRERRSLSKKKKIGVGEEEVRCPVCDETIIGTPDELTEHVNQCLIQEDDGDELDVEGDDDDGFEEYTWAGQTRVRASSMLEGGLAASGFQTSCTVDDEDEDINLDIDGDDSNVYGEPQYSEADLLPCGSEEPQEDKQRKALRNAVLRGDGSKVSRTIPSDRQKWQLNGRTKPGDKRVQKNCEDDQAHKLGVELDTSKSEVIRSLTAKIREQETQLEKLERPKCLICMDWYTKPLTSVQCWHVHCEECWLRTLGTKKLCPQCNIITSPTDLRRIYL